MNGIIDLEGDLAFGFTGNIYLHAGHRNPGRIHGTALVDLQIDNELVTFSGSFAMQQ